MDFSAYRNDLPYPSRENYKTTWWYKSGKCIASQVGQSPIHFEVPTNSRSDALKGAVKSTEFDEAAYKAAVREYSAETARRQELFKQALFDDLGIEDNPKREKLYSIAWDLGHDAGFSEVYSHAQDLVELIK